LYVRMPRPRPRVSGTSFRRWFTTYSKPSEVSTLRTNEQNKGNERIEAGSEAVTKGPFTSKSCSITASCRMSSEVAFPVFTS
jgi:hypothetical protein